MNWFNQNRLPKGRADFEDYCQTQYQVFRIRRERKDPGLLREISLRAEAIQAAPAVLTNEI